MKAHDEAVAHISTQVKKYYDRKQPFRIFHGSTSSTRPAHHARTIDISGLSHILRCDEQSRTIIVEPNVPMDKLVRTTLLCGMIPPVVMEFPGITVGGGFAGSAGESSSFKYGYFDENVKSVEMVLATGKVITASKTENSDLLKGAAGALGTLGITTKLELSLIPAKRFVKLVYHPYPNIHDTITALCQEIINPANDYVDGIAFSNTHAVLMTGRLTDDIPLSTTPKTFSGPRDPWFYLHVKEKPTDETSISYIPVAEYLFRYDRGAFWVGKQAFEYFGFMPFNKYTRWFLNDFMHTRMMYRALHGSEMSSGTMIQDLSLPYETAESFIRYTSKETGIWPLWLCPLRAVASPTFHPHHSDLEHGGASQPMLNIGLWGAASKNIETFIQQNRRLEEVLTDFGGRKVLYSHTYYTEQEFWQLYDREWYEELRQRYSATTLPTVYDKVKVDVSQLTKARDGSWIKKLAS